MKRLPIILLIAAAIFAWFQFDLGHYLTLDALKARQGDIAALYAANPAVVIGGYFAAYVALTALSFPGAAIMTLAGGAIFGLGLGLLIVSFASTIGATLAFLVSRYLLRDWVQGKFGERLAAINTGIERDGAFYLFSLRLVPVFPFFVVNLLMGITHIDDLSRLLGQDTHHQWVGILCFIK